MHFAVARDVSHSDHFAAGGAAHLETEFGSARVAEGHDVLRIVADKPVAPIADRVQETEELLTRLRKMILMPSGPLL